MAVRTGEQFLQGLRDGREVWLEGERVADVTWHPKLTPRVSWFAAQRAWRRWLHFPMRFLPRSTTPLRADVEEDRKYYIGFAVPSNIKGLKFICRPSHDFGSPLADYPLSGQYDEMDSLAVFDDVLVPWERVFLYDNLELGNRTVAQVTLWRHYMQQVAVKNIAKLEFILGIARGITEGIGIGVYGHVQEKTAEIIDTIETCRAFMRAAEADAGRWKEPRESGPRRSRGSPCATGIPTPMTAWPP